LAERLNVTNMADIVNVVILSDHGMTYASPPMKRHHPKGNLIRAKTILLFTSHIVLACEKTIMYRTVNAIHYSSQFFLAFRNNL
jgi:hypothetical protein